MKLSRALSLVSSLSVASAASVYIPEHTPSRVSDEVFAYTPRFWEWKSPRNLVTCFKDLCSVALPSFHSSPQLVLADTLIIDPAITTTTTGPIIRGRDIKTSLVIKNGNVTPDGYTRMAVLTNGTFPGPLITGYKDHMLEVNVSNLASDSRMTRVTSVHWHEIDQHRTNWADGVDFVTQCPIAPESSFNYKFKLTDAGTYWYHSHSHAQYCDGLRGPMIVYDPNDHWMNDYDVDDENTVLTIGDWSHEVPSIRAANSTLFNGKGRYKQKDGKVSDAELAVVNVEKGKRYRLRILNIGCAPGYNFSIQGHNMTVIAADAVEHHGVVASSIEILSGQRYSVILHANQSIDNYWMWAIPDVDNKETTGGINSAILRYLTARKEEPKGRYVDPANVLHEADLHPEDEPTAPGEPRVDGADVYINMSFSKVDGRWLINNETFDNPGTPVLLKLLAGQIDVVPKKFIHTVEPGKVVQITFDNSAGSMTYNHPMHLHGHFFYVIRSAGQKDYNFINPPHRDVVNTGGKGDQVTIRFVKDNAGPWIIHCHIDWHLEKGLAAVIASPAKDVQAEVRPPPEWNGLCKSYYDWKMIHSNTPHD